MGVQFFDWPGPHLSDEELSWVAYNIYNIANVYDCNVKSL